MKKFLVFLLALFTLSFSVKAEECLDKEYINWANDLKPVFTVFHYEDYDHLDMNKYKYAYFLSLSKQRDDVTFTVTDQLENVIPAEEFEEIKLYGAGLYNGLVEETYTINVYGTSKGTCNGKLITTLKYTVPPFNEFYKMGYCDKYKEHKLCQVFTYETENMTLDEFNTIMAEYDKQQNSKYGFLNKLWDFILKAKIYLLCIIIPVIGVSIYYNTRIKKYKKMRNRTEVRRKNKKYLFLLVLLLLTVRVNAGGKCGDVTINEGAITSAGWATRLIMCDWEDTGKKTSIGGGTTFQSAVDAGEELTTVSVESADGKSASEIQVPMCRIKANGGPGQIDAVTYHDFMYEVCDSCGTYGEEDYDSCCSTHYEPGHCESETQQDVSGDIPTPAGCSECASGYSGCTGDTPVVHYFARCPIYQCRPVEQVVEGWCNASFSVDGDSAYCVNPSNPFPAGVKFNYQTQDFDPTKCKSSNSTPDCGFANILIEAEYYSNHNPGDKIDYETRNMALRMWASDLQYSGFHKVGLANVHGYDCYDFAVYPKGNPNVYDSTLEHVWNLYFQALSREGVDHSVEGLIKNNYFKNIGCYDGKLGVVCHGLRDTYVKAFALFFNTYFGNEDMQNHLANMYGDRTTEPTSATVSSEVIDEYSVVEVKYLEEVTIGERIECSDIKEKAKKGETLSLNEEKVLAYCNNQITHVIGVKPDGTMIELSTLQKVEDFNGDGYINQKDFLLLKDAEKNFDFTYCQKNSCFSPTVYFAICDEVKTEEERYETIYTTIKYTESGTRYSVKKYLACGSGDYQIMWSYDDDEKPDKTWQETVPTQKDPVKTLSIDFYCYDAGGCDDYSIRKTKECATEAGGYGTVTVKDPSLRCIVNMQSSVVRKSYDYSEFFGVNSNFCKIYCSDSAEFYLANKVDIYSGLSFKLDIEYKLFGNNKTDKSLSSVVLMKRDCVSKIFYNNKFEDGVDWTQIYHGLASNPNNIKELYASLRKYGLAAGHLNQVLYDLYNCNLYSSIASPVYRPKENKIGNVYNRIIEMYNKDNSYGFNGDKYGYNFGVKLDDTNNDVAYADIKYDGGAYYIGTKNRLASDFGQIKMNYVITDHNKDGKNVSPVSYCSGAQCFAYNKDEDEYAMPASTKNQTTKVKFYNENRREVDVNIPTNDYAYFNITNGVGFYNDSRFQVEPYTGNVKDVTELKPSAYDDDYLTLDKYLYPVSTDAKVECNDGKCNIAHRINVVNTYYRKMGSGTNSFKETIASIVDVCPTDYEPVPIEKKNHTEALFRNVDISNLFPTVQSDGTRRLGANWENSTAYIDEIESYVNSNGAPKYYETHLEYSYTLTQDAIKRIRDYNRTTGGGKTYTDNTIIKGSCVGDDTLKLNCKSSFISDINNNTNALGITNNRFGQERGVSEYTKDLRDEEKD